ncbi:MAG: asparagine synthase (glutamine-hydrolyzing) [Candidatus Omnitrophota bacterium]
MCGIAGIYSKRQEIRESDIKAVQTMNDIQKHRGPDDQGLFSDKICVLGHRRLSIIDLSKDGHQPFFSDDGRYILIFNGEIYNYIELRDELVKLGCRFKTKTDTEVLLKSFEQFGSRCLEKFNGMFAFAIYDKKENSLFLARDRVGVKPLYYCVHNGKLYFASEIKALRSIPGIHFSMSRQAVFDYLVFNRTDIFDETFLNEIKRIPKGHYATFRDEKLQLIQWWDPESYFNQNISVSLDEASKHIRDLLVSSVDFRLRSDVTVGSCLSGGLDSSILTGILFSHHAIEQNYSTFTASIPGHKIDETKYVDALNQKYPFKNYRTFPDGQKAFKDLRDFVYAIDEPSTDATYYAQYEVMRLAKEHNVTVLLDGQGGDEVFAGYPYFLGFYLYGLWNKKRIGKFAYELGKSILRRQERLAYETFLFQVLPDVVKKKILMRQASFINPDFFKEHIDSSLIYKKFFDASSLNVSLLRHFQYKLEHLLRLEDRNSMIFSLEARVPYLDYRLIEYVLGLSEDLKIRSGETKFLQKQAVGRYTVDEILNRKDKIGFGVPTQEWMSIPQWRQMTEESYEQLQESFPEIFRNNSVLPEENSYRWKISQLNTWKGIVSIK